MKNKLINLSTLILIAFVIFNIFTSRTTNLWILLLVVSGIEIFAIKFAISSKIYYLFALTVMPCVIISLITKQYFYAEYSSYYIYSFLILEYTHQQILKILKIKETDYFVFSLDKIFKRFS
jgi:hypothetical protein